MQDVRNIMAEMSEVVSAMMDRVMVDLAGDDIAQCMQIFNVHSWGDRKQQHMLEPHIKTLSKALKLDARVQSDFGSCKMSSEGCASC